MDNEIVNILRDVIREELKPINNKLNSLENKVDSLGKKVGNLENKVDSLEIKVDGLKIKVDGLEIKVDGLQVQVKENTRILNALVYSAEINKSEHDSMKNDVIHIIGTVESIKKDLSQVEIITASNWGDIAKLKAVR